MLVAYITKITNLPSILRAIEADNKVTNELLDNEVKVGLALCEERDFIMGERGYLRDLGGKSRGGI